jgi:hypothetical protein
MTPHDPDPFATRPPGPAGDDTPTAPVDLPGVERPPANPSPPPAAPWPGSVPPAPEPRRAPPTGTPRSSPAWAPATAPRSDGQPGLVIGIILVIVGALLLVTRVADVAFGPDSWPLWIVVPGVAMLVGSFAVAPRGGLGLAVPGAIIATVGLVLWVQERYDAYATWAYAWALVAPTAAGLGTLLYALVKGDRELVADGFRTTVVGLALFTGFALFFEGVVGLSGEPIANLDEVLPYGVIGLGVLLVALSLFGGSRRGSRPT